MKLAEMTSPEVDRLSRDTPVVIPLAAVEQHNGFVDGVFGLCVYIARGNVGTALKGFFNNVLQVAQGTLQ